MKKILALIFTLYFCVSGIVANDDFADIKEKYIATLDGKLEGDRSVGVRPHGYERANIGYYELEKDGVKYLIIGENWTGDSTSVYGLYSFDGKEIKNLYVDSGLRNVEVLEDKDGNIVIPYSRSYSVNDYFVGYHELKGGELKSLAEFEYDNDKTPKYQINGTPSDEKSFEKALNEFKAGLKNKILELKAL